MTDVRALVEAAAQAIAGDEWPADGVEVDERGNDYADLDREPYRAQARRALAAALPMLVEVLATEGHRELSSQARALWKSSLIVESDAVTNTIFDVVQHIRAEGARLAAALQGTA